MNEKKIENILERILKIFNESYPPKWGWGPIIIRHDDTFNGIIKQLIKEKGWEEKFSEKFLIERINGIIESMIGDKNSEKASFYLNRVIEELESYNVEQVAYVPLFGIEMPIGQEVKLGNVTIKYMDDQKVEAIKNKVYKDKITREEIEKFIHNHVCAEFHIVAEPYRALARAEYETRRAIDLIRYAIPAIYRKGHRVFVGLQGEICHAYRYVPINPIDSASFSGHGSVIGPLYGFEISKENMATMENLGVFRLSDIIKKEDISDFEKILLSSMHWFANSQMKMENEDQLLNLVTCLEIIFTPESDDPIIQNIAEGVAILIGEDVNQRKKIIERIRYLYKQRSTLSHHGRGEILDIDLQDLIGANLMILSLLIDRRNDFNSKAEFHKWIEYRKLGGSKDQKSWEAFNKPEAEG